MIQRLIARVGNRLGGLAGDRLAWRIAMTILLGIIGTQIASILLIYSIRPHEVSFFHTDDVVAEIARKAVQAAPPAGKRDLFVPLDIPDDAEPPAETMRQPWNIHELQLRLQEALAPQGITDVEVRPSWLASTLGAFSVPLRVVVLSPRAEEHRPGPIELGSGRPPPPPPFEAGGRPPFEPPPENLLIPDHIMIWLKDADGNWRAFIAKSSQQKLPHWIILSLWLLLMIAIIGGVALWSTWRLLRPLKRIAAATRQWQAGQAPARLEESGPAEFRAIASAINGMQQKISEFVQGRSELVLALSHDLRTPLTRLQLRTEYMEDSEQRQRMLNELHFMEMLTDQLLAFASFDPRTEKIERVDLAVLVGSLCDDRNDAGAVVEYAGPAHLIVACRPTAMRRALMNVIDNAIKYSDYTYVVLEDDPAGARVIIRDSGPGIPESDLELVFEPFYRVDASRNSETGGLGMGLSVARTIIIEHRGQIRLRNRRPHGLEVEIELPVSEAA